MAETKVEVSTGMRITLKGRVDLVVQRTSDKGKTFRTLVRTPAQDAYSSPGTFEVRSLSRLGAEGQEISVLCDLRGYSRSYETKDGETVRTAECVLQAV